MHPVIYMMNWSRHLHDSWMVARCEVDQHLHSGHFWAGLSVALLIIGALALLVLFAMNAPVGPMSETPFGMP